MVRRVIIEFDDEEVHGDTNGETDTSVTFDVIKLLDLIEVVNNTPICDLVYSGRCNIPPISREFTEGWRRIVERAARLRKEIVK